MKLLEPIKIRKITLRNRIVMPAMDTNMGDKKGNVTDKMIKYYEERAKGGVGLIILEPAYFDRRGRQSEKMLRIDSDDAIEGFRKVTSAIKKHGAGVLIQMYHAGSQAASFITGMTPVSASDVPCQLTGEVPIPLIVEDIQNLIKSYAAGAERAKRGGFDGVEVHAGHGYILNQFLSPANNKRTDKYGGPLENRMRLVIEILHAIRKKCGPDFIICYRLNGDDFVDNGLKIEETIEVAKALEENGVDLIHISAGVFECEGFPTVPYMNYPKATFSDFAAQVKDSLDHTPVITVGRINHEIGEQILQEGKADLVAIGRGLLGDPYLPKKVEAGKTEAIRQCISCNTCINQILINKPVACALNANLYGSDEEIGEAEIKKKVLIIGAGPGGLEAARVAKLRGHEVLLIEKGIKLGGSLHLAKAAPMKKDVDVAIRYYEYWLEQMGVEIRLNSPYSSQIIEEYKPDVVVLATGAVPIIPPIKGLDQRQFYTFEEILKGKIPLGHNVMIIGGGMVGLEVAERLSHLSKSVTIVEMLRRIGANVHMMVAKEVVPLIEKDQRIDIHVNTKVEEIRENYIIGSKKDESNPVQIEFDSLVIATGSKPNDGLVTEIEPLVSEIHKIGDCKKTRKIIDAVQEGYQVALQI
jgi:2,4-dienoyl-CoA reductase-like NADH-dependent reductase (Old Yellow Enzyme family)/thioredoxin reductase